MKNNRGSVFLVTLAFLGLLAANAFYFSWLTRRHTEEWNVRLSRYRGTCLARAGALAGLAILEADTNASDYLGESWATEKRIVFPDSPVMVTISDMESRFNLNTLLGKENKTDEKGITLFRNLMLELGAQSELTDALLDWLDEDDFPRVFGAESEYYGTLSPPYTSAGAPFLFPEQLFLVKGFTPQLLRGSEERPGLLDLVTTVSEGKINVNTAHPCLLKAMGFGTATVERITAERSFKPLDERTLTDFAKDTALAWRSHIVYKSTWFRITAVAEKFGAASTVSLLVKRKGNAVHIVSWECGGQWRPAPEPQPEGEL